MTHKACLWPDLLLNNGLRAPALGIGTSEVESEAGMAALKRLLREKAFRHVDTASCYGNEGKIGKVLGELFEEGSLRREDVFVTTKVWRNEMEDVEGALRRSLAALKLGHVDLYLMHWPIQVSGPPGAQTWLRIPMHRLWAQMERLVDLGLARSIGVSNFNFQLLNDLLSYARIRPVCNQIELHPYLGQHDFVEWLKREHIVPVAYSPLCRATFDGEHTVLNDKLILQLAEVYGRSPAQITLAWHFARGHLPLPRTSSYERGVENAAAQQFRLEPEDVAAINRLNRNFRVMNMKDWKGVYEGIPLFE